MKTTMKQTLLTVAFAAIAVASTGAQSQTPASLPRSGSDPQFKVRLDFNRWHDHAELKSDFQRLEKVFPKFLKLSSLGKSHGGRDILLMTINNPATGADTSKPAMYIEANVHGNEIQGAEVSLYTIWYLMEHYDRVPQIKKGDERPSHRPHGNHDGREHFKGTGAGSRTGHVRSTTTTKGTSPRTTRMTERHCVIEQIRK